MKINIKRLKYYLKLWWHFNIRLIMPFFTNNKTFVVFLLGKIIRFLLFGGFIYFLLKQTNSLAGYTFNQTMIFFLTFNLIDILSQFLFREVYRFWPLLVSGDFDLVCLKPMNPLFRVLLGGADAIDLITLPPLLIIIYYFCNMLDPTYYQVLFYILLVINGLIVAAAFHIAVLALGIITLEIDHTIMVYRDLTAMGRFPIDIYKEPLRGILTYIIPVGLMISVPAKAVLGLINPLSVVASFAISIIFIYASIKVWQLALKKYTSASS